MRLQFLFSFGTENDFWYSIRLGLTNIDPINQATVMFSDFELKPCNYREIVGASDRGKCLTEKNNGRYLVLCIPTYLELCELAAAGGRV